MDGAKHDPYHWMRAETARELARRVTDAGAGLVRVEIRIDKARRGEPMTFRLIVDTPDGKATTQSLDGDLNDSWLCPPICPGGGG